MVFDNSIGIVTRDGKEFFFTSFVFRDIAYDLIFKQIELFNNRGSLDTAAQG